MLYLNYSKPAGLIPLAGAKVSKEKEKKRYCFRIITYTGHEVISYAKDKKEMKEWVSVIKKVSGNKPGSLFRFLIY